METDAPEAGRPSERVDEVVGLIRAKVATDQADLLAAFVRQYFGQVDPEDLADRQIADLYGAAPRIGASRESASRGAPGCAVFNPTIAEHGWQSTHTIIEIVNDDMPFLVDSVTMEVNRHGLTLHLIIHPLIAVDARQPSGTLQGLATEAGLRPMRGASRSSMSRSTAWPTQAALEALAADLARVLGDVRAGRGRLEAMKERVLAHRRRAWTSAPRRSRRRNLPKARPSCAGWPTTTSPSSATAATSWRRSTARTRSRWCRIRAWASCARREQGAPTAAFAALPPEVRAYARRPGVAGSHQVHLALHRAPARLP